MTVFEMHVQFNQRFQEVASYKRDKFRPEEIDLALNKAMYRLLEQGVDTRFQGNQINLSHVTALVKKNRPEEVIKPSTTDPLYENPIATVYAVLPPDFYWLVNARAEVVEDLVNCSTAPALATVSMTEYVAPVVFPDLDSGPPYFDNFRVRLNSVSYIYTSPSTINAGFNSPNSKYVVIQNVIEYFAKTANTGFKVYWERYRDVYYQDSFIFVSTSPFSTIELFSGDKSSSAAAVATAYTIYNRGLISAITNGKTSIKSTTNKDQGNLYDILTNNKYYNTRKTQPVITQTQDYLILYPDESFLITRTYFDYIRKPRTISLVLNQSCELSDTTHPRIIDLAIEIIRLDTKDQAYPATVQDTELRTT